ncbi:hemolysin III family protein [Mediterraneibacter catenae]|jgi:hemolysin III|uniref:Hemolysin III family protein n=1 Tax=Mediterraneibacter catenae TaxID=2594882 RepID=A0A5M9I3J3_9FIRM|nr:MULTISPECIES: hemolysin III family protein [Mediterraneibacter]KAA8501972.1 hemolysin III family protein [Mediterraneibacter catenae]MCF2570370.1 hemolysin III family protein [Mediterraneibacter glycyrrhizinilyticus]OUO31265.1 hemolysin [Lachnoclostridium sp. An298]HJA18443.1 hemolysin III family protein [Candidatus Mediterraneibacter ornithocaccae]
MENTGTITNAINISSKAAIRKQQPKRFHIKEPGSAITHFIGMVMAIFAAVPLLFKAAREPDRIYIISMTIYAASLILLYAASTTYHTFDISEKVNTILKKIDHMMISVLIAGSYTPVCLIVLKGRLGIILLSIVWAIAIAGILIKAFWVYCPKWVSSVLYIGMGWTCVLAFTQLLNNLSPAAFGWLLAGGIIYTVGGVIYALKLPLFNSRHKNFGSHEIFHLFVMAGSACHFVVMYAFLLP